MKHVPRLSALVVILAAAFMGSPLITPHPTISSLQSGAPGGGGPMPVCNPFEGACPLIR